MSKLFLYQNVRAYYPSRARLIMAEKDVPFVGINVDVEAGETLPKFLKLDSSVEIPVLIHGSQVITDSQDIVEYVDNIDTPLGDGIVDPIVVDKWSRLVSDWDGNVFIVANCRPVPRTLEKYAASNILDRRASGKKPIINRPSRQAMRNNREHLDLVLNMVQSQLLLSPFIAGDSYTRADVMLTVLLYCLVVSNRGDLLTGRDSIIAYLRRIQNRPSFATTFLNPYSIRKEAVFKCNRSVGNRKNS